MKDPYTLHTLDNGLRVVIEVMPDVCSAAAGFLARTGARDETPKLAGVSHFLEHMMFKGTAKRDWRKITIDFDNMGSSYNAFTSEERTFYYGWVRRSDIGKQIELLADMMRSKLPTGEFDMERNVILEEIAMSKDHLEHVAYDFILEKIFGEHPLGWPVLGYQHTVEPMDRDRMMEYFRQRYAPDNLMLIVAGNVDPDEIIAMAREHCGSWEPSGIRRDRIRPTFRSGTEVSVTDRFNQQFVAITFPSVGSNHEFTETAEAASAILGGGNSRFFWNIVQTGISPRTSVYHVQYEDCGLMLLCGVCQPENSEKFLDAMRAEADQICREKVQPREIERVKNRRRTSLAVGAEAPYHRLTQVMEDMDTRGAPRTVDQMLADIDTVSADSVEAYFEQYPINIPGHLSSVGPRDWPKDQ